MSYKPCTCVSDDKQMHRDIHFPKPALDWGMPVLRVQALECLKLIVIGNIY